MRARHALIALPLVLATACSSGTKPPTTALAPCTPKSFTSVGEALPDCTFEGYPGSPPLRLTELKGKPLVLNFWASWCIACIREMPAFQRAFASLGGKVTFVGMNVIGLQGETKTSGEGFAKRAGVRYLLAFDQDGLLYEHFSTRTLLPVTVFVGADLVVKQIHFGGPIGEQDLRADITKFLGVA